MARVGLATFDSLAYPRGALCEFLRPQMRSRFCLAVPRVATPADTGCFYSGRLVELKGVQPFLKALAAWASNHRDRKVEFWITGDGPLRAALSTFAGPPNLEIRMLGHVSYDHLPKIYGQCGILAFPSLADEWGMVVIEAMASGMPVLGSIYSQAVEELVSDGETGWTFNPNESQQMGEAISEALAAPLAR